MAEQKCEMVGANSPFSRLIQNGQGPPQKGLNQNTHNKVRMSTEKTLEKNFGLVLLAAGKSSRLGQPKQLLSYGDDSLLKHSLRIANTSVAHPVIIVLGAHADNIKRDIGEADSSLVVNENWEEGMASSIRCGLKALNSIDPNAEGVIIMACDQPYVTADLLNNLVSVHQQTQKIIVTCSYENTYGPPSFFHRSLFPELMQLTGDVGARSLVQRHPDEVEMIPFPTGMIDIDTAADYENLRRQP